MPKVVLYRITCSVETNEVKKDEKKIEGNQVFKDKHVRAEFKTFF